MLKFAMIIGSTRPNRFADIPAKWIVDGATKRDDFTLDVLDLREHPLPFFNEPMPVGYVGGKFSEAAAEAWRHEFGQYDGFIVTAAEYNHAPTGVLKNAFDSASFEWHRKPIAFVGYGGVGGARAIEHLRGIAVELQMAPFSRARRRTIIRISSTRGRPCWTRWYGGEMRSRRRGRLNPGSKNKRAAE